MSYKNIEIAHLAKNCNETLILSLLSREMKHGYQIALEIENLSNDQFKFNHGTLYPILHKLEKDGLIRGRWREEGTSRKRKYYTLTGKGEEYLKAQRQAWDRFYNTFYTILGAVTA
ncbi:PadR family transcriptional regulator [candidate division KSB1 bacterium]